MKQEQSCVNKATHLFLLILLINFYLVLKESKPPQ